MSTRDIPFTVIDEPNVVLRNLLLYSVDDRAKNTSAYHKVEVGLRDGESTTWVGEWDQSEQNIDAGEPLRVVDDDRIGMRLPQDMALVVRVTRVGAPAVSIDTAKVHATFGRVGGRAGEVRPLVSVGQGILDANARTAIAALSRQINSGGLSEWSESVALLEPEHGDEPAFDAQDSYTTTDKTFTAGAGVSATDVSITFTKPSWATTGFAKVTAVSSVVGAAGGFATHSIYDGTTDHNSISFTIAASDARAAVVVFAGEITATTTFTYRASATTANATMQESMIGGTCSWV